MGCFQPLASGLIVRRDGEAVRLFTRRGYKGSLLPPSLILIICARRPARLRGISRWLA
jgi:hypothetical protein